MLPRLSVAVFCILALAGGAAAAMCVVDPETLEIRDHLLPTDNQYLVADETGAALDWVANGDPIIDSDRTYQPYGPPRAGRIADLALQGFVSGVPLLKPAGAPDVPDIIYLLLDPKICRIQAYRGKS
ncbi:MAG TPA: hypothetical protein VG894_01925 [Bauldia sp.]|nr:hypothetical protein [Bauldia sp.]